jgi:hypothetical protein
MVSLPLAVGLAVGALERVPRVRAFAVRCTAGSKEERQWARAVGCTRRTGCTAGRPWPGADVNRETRRAVVEHYRGCAGLPEVRVRVTDATTRARGIVD